MLRKYSDVYTSIALLIFATVMFGATLNINRLTDSVVGSEFAPRLVAGGIFILSIILLINGIRSARLNNVPENELDKIDIEEFMCEEFIDEEEQEVEEINYRKVSMVIVLFGVYIALMKPIGFLIMTVVYLITTMIILASPTQRNITLFSIISIIVSVTVYYLFKNVFYLILPAGILG